MRTDRSLCQKFNGYALKSEKWRERKSPITVKQILPGMSMGIVVGIAIVIFFW